MRSEATLQLESQLRAALDARADLLAQCASENTDCLRLFHGAVEGVPGLAIDRYGPLLLAQTWRDRLSDDELATIRTVLAEPLGLPLVWNHRGPGGGGFLPEGLPEEPVGHELGLKYDVTPRHKGNDPLLFLDFRAARRWVRDNAEGKSVLNLFAYTSGIGVAAAAGGASKVWNVDFAKSALDVGARNAALNGVQMEQVWQNCLPAMRQLAGLPLGLRQSQAKVRYRKFKKRDFDLVVLDPPRWAKTPFGAVDVVRDYASLFKPALLTMSPGGAILATNHVPEVDLDDWISAMKRTAEKAGRPLTDVRVIAPESDFPSPDGRPPLKIVVARAS